MATATPAAATVKVFVGNLSFKTRNEDLTREFGTVGKVVSANIIMNGPRSLGYGFVEFENETVANAAVAQMNHKELDGRPINVEVARKRDAAAPPMRRQPRFPRQGPPRMGMYGYMPMPPMYPAAPVPQAPAQAAPVAAQPVPVPPQQFAQYAPMYPQRMRGPPMYMGQPQFVMMQQPRFQRRQRPPQQPQVDKTPSKTTLFIGNLPFVVEDQLLREIFQEFNVKEARVMKRPNGKSKGYGFVELATEADQTRALQTLDKVVIENRELAIKPAFSDPFAPQARKLAVTTNYVQPAGDPPKPTNP